MKTPWLSLMVRLAAVLAVVIAVGLATFAIPLRTWRTGEALRPPIALVKGGPDVVIPNRVWIDTDAACGNGRTADPDDCFALLLLLRARGLEIAGVSTVHGNASLEVTDATTRNLVGMMTREGSRTATVHRGSAQAIDLAPSDATPAVVALRDALARGPLTVVALGPLTNVAVALTGRPELQRNVARLMAVMGRQPGHLFHPSEDSGRGMLFGHGPVFRDFNFDKDRNAAAQVVAMKLPLTLIPYVASRQVSLTAADLALFEARQGSTAWVASRARGWLAYWEHEIGRMGFYPFDLVAAAYVLRPQFLSCALVQAAVMRDLELWGTLYGPEALLVFEHGETPRNARSAGQVLFCAQVEPQMHAWLVSSLADPHS
jgi:purine nucleosidase